MTFSQDGFVERGQQGQSQQQKNIQSNNFGGLNRIASPLNCPFEDSPDIRNIDVDVSGNQHKRKGTKVLRWDKALPTIDGVSLVPFTTGLGYNFVINKVGVDLKILEVINDVALLMMTKSNVFTDDAASIRLNYVSTNEIEPRLIITTGICPPVQLKFVEQQSAFTALSTVAVISSATRFANATTANTVFFLNRVRTAPTSVVYSAGLGTLTVTFSGAQAIGTTIDCCLVAWQWWAESYFYLGERFSGTAIRSSSAQVIDRVVAIPSSLRDSIDTLRPALPNTYPIFAYKSTAYAQAYTLSTALNPANRVEYAHCDGVPYSAGGITTPSPLFITFGGNADGATACDATGRPQVAGAATCPGAMPIVFIRRRFINFNGGQGCFPVNTNVYLGGVSIPQNTNPAASLGGFQGSYYAWQIDGTTQAGAARLFAIDFTAGSEVGVSTSTKVEIVNTQPQYLGAGSLALRGSSGADINRDGTWVSAYGLGDFCNYASGSFPTNVAIYQGRLVFSGFLENTLKVVCSNQYDSVIPGSNFSHYQIDSVATLATDAFDFTISSSPDDVTKALVEWQQSLFVMTRKAVFRISGGSANASITNINRVVTLVSNIGLINSYSVCRTDKAIMYLSDTGVFDLSTTIESTEYVAGEKSLKIRPLFGAASKPLYESLAWLAFDSANKIVFLAYPQEKITKTAYRLLVYSTFREAWSEYYTPGGFNSFHGTTFVDRALGQQFGISCTTYRTLDTLHDLVLIRTNYSKYIDFAQEVVGTGGFQSIEIHPKQRFATTTTNLVRQYATDRADTGYAYGTQVIPITNVNDLTVFLETGAGSNAYNRLVFGVDWQKTPNGSIYLLTNPGGGKRLFVDDRLPVTDSAEGKALYSTVVENLNISNSIVFVDNVFVPENPASYTLGVSGVFGGTMSLVSIVTAVNAIIVVGQAYAAYYYSPVFTQETLAQMKRMRYLYAYFDNRDGLPSYSVSDLNVASGQTIALVGSPKQRLNVNLSLKYEENDSSENFYDSYGFSSLFWDEGLFDLESPPTTYRKHIMFKQALLGISYSYQFIAWSYDETAFTLSGYQIVASPRGDKHINWSK